MQSQTTLPSHYRPMDTIDLQKNKKQALLVNGLALIIAAVLVLAALPSVSLRFVFDSSSNLFTLILKCLVMLIGVLVYLVLHELVHGIFMRRFSGVKPRYGFTGLYAYAGSDAYFCKGHYLIIALAPVVIWGLVLAVLTALVPTGWFWVVYMIQIMNLSGAAGDLYVTVRFARLPADILVQDTGVSMTVFAPASGV